MKVNILPFVLLFALVGLVSPSLSVQAQDKGLSPNELLDPNHSELSVSDDKALPVDHESKPKVAGRDSSMMNSKLPTLTNPVSKSKSAEHKTAASKDEDDDALSFNFLYYIIEKFKISDLIDE